MGVRQEHLARGEDDRHVEPAGSAPTISAESTFARDEADADTLARDLWPLCERVASRLKQADLAAGTVTLKLKTAEFRLLTRSHTLADPTQLAEMLFQNAKLMLARESDGTTRFSRIGV